MQNKCASNMSMCLNCKSGRHTLCANYDPECYKPSCPCRCKGKENIIRTSTCRPKKGKTKSMKQYLILLPIDAVLFTLIISLAWSDPVNGLFWIIFFGLIIMGSMAIGPFFIKNENERIREGMQGLEI